MLQAISRREVPDLEGLANDAGDALDDADLGLIQNNDTRWNSTFLMIERAIRLRPNVEVYLSYLEAHRLDSINPLDRLTSRDWILLTEISEVLREIYHQTKRMEGRGEKGHHGSLWEVLGGMEYLLAYLESKRQIYTTFGESLDQATEILQANPLPRRRRPASRDLSVIPVHARPDLTQFAPRDPDASPAYDLNDDHRIFLAASINLAWAKLEAYYDELSQSPLYAGALILHPAFNFRKLEELWSLPEQRRWLDEADRDLRLHFNVFYPAATPADAAAEEANDLRQQGPLRRRERSAFEQFMASGSRRFALEPAEDEVTRYYREPPVDDEDDEDPGHMWNPLSWWRLRLKGPNAYKRLGRLALDIHAIPATSCEPERTFSLAKLVMSTQRQRISDETFEHIVCLKTWERQGGMKV